METIVYGLKKKARKTHRCDLCSLPIEAGSNYLYSVFKNDDIYSWKMHQHCSDIADKLKMYNECGSDGLDSDTFREYINDNHYTITKNSDDDISFSERLDLVLKYHGIEKQFVQPTLKSIKNNPDVRIDLSDLEGEYSLDEMPKVIDTIKERIDDAKKNNCEHCGSFKDNPNGLCISCGKFPVWNKHIE